MSNQSSNSLGSKTVVPTGDNAAWIEVVRRQVERLRFGVVQIVVHDRRVVQVESTEKIRLDPPPANER